MKGLAKLLICYSCLSSAFSHGMREGPYSKIFSPETSEAWKSVAQPRDKLSSKASPNVDIAQALLELQACDKDDKIAKYLIENVGFTYSNQEFKHCWTKCYNSWKQANSILANLTTKVERIDCGSERAAYQLAASKAVMRLVVDIYGAQFYAYDRQPTGSLVRTYFTGLFKENHDADQSATRQLFDSIDLIMPAVRASNYTSNPGCSDVHFFMSATPDDIKIGEALYWQREAELLLFDVQVALLMEAGADSIDIIKEAVELRGRSLRPPEEDNISFEKILNDRAILGAANKLLAESISHCSLNTSIAAVIANKCENLMRIDCITADQKDAMMQKSVDMFFDMFVRRHLLQFLSSTTDLHVSTSMIKELKSDFTALHRIIVACVNLHSASVEGVSEELTSLNDTINSMRMAELVKVVKDIPHETMTQLMDISPENFARLKSVGGDDLVPLLDQIPAGMQWLKDLNSTHKFIKPTWGIPRSMIISSESMEHLTALTPEMLQQLQEAHPSMRDIFMKTPIEFAESIDHEIDVIGYMTIPLIERVNLICQKDGDIKAYTEGWMQYILEVLKNFKKTELTYGVQLALSSASEIVIHNRLNGAFKGSYTPENVLDCFFDLIKNSIQKTAIIDIMNEVLGASDVQTARTKIVSKYVGIFSKKFGEKLALELIKHKSVNTQNENLYNKYVEELNATTKACLLNNTSKLTETSQRLYGNASYAVQLISMISKTDDPYKVYGALDSSIEYLLKESILNDYIGSIKNIQIRDAVIHL